MSMETSVKYLIIDDERTLDKVEATTSAFFDKVVYARNLEDARFEIFGENKRWDRVYLDHDLGNGQDVITLCDEIEQRTVENEELLNIKEFIIHSMNPVGRQRMYAALSGYYNVKFARVEDLI